MLGAGDESGDAGPRLVGGLYGLAMGRAFFGESMFSQGRQRLEGCHGLAGRARCGPARFTLLDCQFVTSHLASLGAVEVNARRLIRRCWTRRLAPGAGDPAGLGRARRAGIADALRCRRPPRPALPATLTVSAPVSGQLIAQLITQTS